MSKLRAHTLEKYLNVLSQRTPAPGGGSAAALTGALGASLLCMVTNFSRPKKTKEKRNPNMDKLLKQLESIRRRLLILVDLDAQAYLNVVKASKKSLAQKKIALRKAQKVCLETCQLCYKAVTLAVYLAKHGNKYLISDVQVAVELLMAAFNGALVLSRDQ